jgi:HEAT repeat protein
MFGKIGAKATEPLKKFALDKSNTSFCRGVALEGLGAVAAKNENFEREILDFIAQFLKDEYEDMGLRGSAGSILLDFGEVRYKKSLLEFVADEEEMKQNDPFYVGTFDEEWIEENLEKGRREPEIYMRDQLDFYSEEEIAKRQKRWKKERSWRGKMKSFWINRKIEKDLKNFYDKKIREK